MAKGHQLRNNDGTITHADAQNANEGVTLQQQSAGLATKENVIPAGTIKQYLRGDKSWTTLPTAKLWSGTTTGGVCTIYLTNNGLAGGSAFYSSINSIMIAFAINDTNLGKSYTISGDLKTLTITATQQSFNGVVVLSIPVLGSITVSAVPNGTTMTALVHGIPA